MPCPYFHCKRTHVVMSYSAVAHMTSPIQDASIPLSLEEACLRPVSLLPQHVLGNAIL
jgi:hypothetical protein